MPSQYGVRGRGRQNRNIGSTARPGLLGAAPGISQTNLLDSISSRSNQRQMHPEPRYERPQYEDERPTNQRSASPFQGRDDGNYDRHQSYPESRDRPYSYESREYDERDQRNQGSSSDRLSPEVRQLMKNLGLSNSDMEELSRLPESDLSANNLANAIRELRRRKQSTTQQHDHRAIDQRQEPRGQGSFRQQQRSPTPEDLYDPAEPTDDHMSQGRYDEGHYRDSNPPERVDEAFSTFEQKWYSDQSPKKNEREEHQQGSSILRASRGPVASRGPPPKQSRWEREEPPPPRRSPPPRPAQQRPPPQLPPKPRIGGLLGNPHDPSTQELDLLAATISGKRNNNYHQEDDRDRFRKYAEPEPYVEPVRAAPQPQQLVNPLINQVPNQASMMLEAQIKAMQVLQSEAFQQQVQQKNQVNPPPLMGVGLMGPGGSAPGPGRRGGRARHGMKERMEERMSFTKEEAQQEATKMRMNQGRVLYFRYRCPPSNVLTQSDLVVLAAPFEKVTNILIAQPKNARTTTGWYQAFIELENFDGAAAMLEHYMVRPAIVKGITIQAQRSNHQTLKLREKQQEIGTKKFPPKRSRPFSISPDRSHQRRSSGSRTRSPERSKNHSRSPPRDKGRKERDSKDRKKGEVSKSNDTSNKNKDEPKRKDGAPPSKARKESPKKTENKKSDGKAEEATRKKSDGGTDAEDFMLVDEVGEESEQKVKEDPKTEPESEKKPEVVANIKKESKPHNTKDEESKTPTKNGTIAAVVKKEPSETKEKNGTITAVVKKNPDESETKSGIEDEKVGSAVENEASKNRKSIDGVVEDIQQACNMSEALLKIVQQNSTKAIITDILEYLTKSLTTLNEVKLKQ